MAKLILAIDTVKMKKATIMLNPTPTIRFLHSHAPPLVKVIEGCCTIQLLRSLGQNGSDPLELDHDLRIEIN